jgi:large subunit ribosomal protein L7e
MRLRDKKQVPNKIEKTLRQLRLSKKNTGVFLKANEDAIKYLLQCEDQITFGYPDRKSIEALIYKRGYIDEDGKRVPLVNNTLIEKKLGSLGVLCVEDVIKEIECLGDNFERVNEILWY